MDNPCKQCPELNMVYINDCEYGCDNPCEKAKEFYGSIGKKLDELLDTVKQIDLCTTNILFGHPEDLFKMDMKQIPSNCCFISNLDVKRGELLLIKDEELKKSLYEFAYNNPDRVFRGENDFKE